MTSTRLGKEKTRRLVQLAMRKLGYKSAAELAHAMQRYPSTVSNWAAGRNTMTVKAEKDFRNFLKIRGINTRRRNGTVGGNGKARKAKQARPLDHVEMAKNRPPWDAAKSTPKKLSTEGKALLELTLELPRAERKSYFMALLAEGL